MALIDIAGIGGLGVLRYNPLSGEFNLQPTGGTLADVRALQGEEIARAQPFIEQFTQTHLPYIQEQHAAGAPGFTTPGYYSPGVTPVMPTPETQAPLPEIPYTPEQVGTAGQLEEIQNYFTQRYGDELYQQGTPGERAFNEYLGAVLPNIQQQELMNYMQSQTGFGALQPNIPWQPPPQTPYSLEPQQPFGGMGMLAPNAEWLGPTQPTSSGFVPNMEWLGSIQSQAAQQTAPSYSLPGQMAGRPLYDMGGQQQSSYFNPMNNAWNYQQGQSFAQAEPWRSVFA